MQFWLCVKGSTTTARPDRRNLTDGRLPGPSCSRDRNRCIVFRRHFVTHGTRFSSTPWHSVGRLDIRHSFLQLATFFGAPLFVAFRHVLGLHTSTLIRLGLRCVVAWEDFEVNSAAHRPFDGLSVAFRRLLHQVRARNECGENVSPFSMVGKGNREPRAFAGFGRTQAVYLPFEGLGCVVILSGDHRRVICNKS